MTPPAIAPAWEGLFGLGVVLVVVGKGGVDTAVASDEGDKPVDLVEVDESVEDDESVEVVMEDKVVVEVVVVTV